MQWFCLISQLANCSEVGPSSQEVWDFFAAKMPIISKWQVESLDGNSMGASVGGSDSSSGVDAINSLFTQVVTHLEQNTDITVSKVNINVGASTYIHLQVLYYV